MKLKKILQESQLQEMPKLSKKEFMQRIAEFRSLGEQLSKLANYNESIEKIEELCQNAETYIMSEQDEWFDNVTVKKNMNELGGYYKSFQKTAMEAKQIQERLLGLYEQMGFVLNRYFNLNEVAMNEQNPEEDHSDDICPTCGDPDCNRPHGHPTNEYGGPDWEDDESELVAESGGCEKCWGQDYPGCENCKCPRCKGYGTGCSACGGTGTKDGYKKEIELNKKNPYRQNYLANKNNAKSDRMEEYGGPDWEDDEESDELSKFNDIPKSDICGKCKQHRPGDKNVEIGMPCKSCSGRM